MLVYPHEADITLKRPVGAALIGLSVGQAIEFQTPGHNKRSLRVCATEGGVDMRDVSTKQAALTVIGFTVVLAAVLYLATFFKA